MSDNRIDTLRLPPQSIEAEMAVLGGLMLDPDAYYKINLIEEDFYRRDFRLIFRGITELHEKKKPYDAVTLGEWFEANCLSEQIGGNSFLVDLAAQTPSAANIKAYADIVKEKALLRKMIEAGTGIVNAAFSPNGMDVSEILYKAQESVNTLNIAQTQIVKTATDGLNAMLTQMKRNMEGGDPTGLSWGDENLDREMERMEPGDLIIIAGRPSMGKTALALRPMIENGRGLFLSMEMSAAKVCSRLVANRGQVNMRAIKRPSEAEDWENARVFEGVKQVQSLDLLIEDRRMSFTEFESLAIRLHQQKPLKWICADHLGYFVRGHKRRDDLELGDISKGCKALAKKLNIPVILLAQLNRSLEQRSNKRPILSDIRECGSLEEDADIIHMLYRDDYYKEATQHKDGYIEILRRKQRDSEPGTTYAKAILGEMRFEYTDQPPSYLARNADESGNNSRKTGFRKSSQFSRAGLDN
jgi:replicative DNA helicase